MKQKIAVAMGTVAALGVAGQVGDQYGNYELGLNEAAGGGGEAGGESGGLFENFFSFFD